ncbi:hypothetical protein HYPSUDRAFT_206535 [Hypholoma sublateritium FD-334 SS-4]|uniref:Uncharacterized protein n=1 Tax=Hypholoma sublateritium (strain FD-334 SS-4) TaxID=945553 RepID=A0A0D2NKH8_HYPSF|nr:hypothetical protein HYPSUDRAFT_206535 [Hypholoma sublateritium FD-334 SS-4]
MRCPRRHDPAPPMEDPLCTRFAPHPTALPSFPGSCTPAGPAPPSAPARRGVHTRCAGARATALPSHTAPQTHAKAAARAVRCRRPLFAPACTLPLLPLLLSTPRHCPAPPARLVPCALSAMCDVAEDRPRHRARCGLHPSPSSVRLPHAAPPPPGRAVPRTENTRPTYSSKTKKSLRRRADSTRHAAGRQAPCAHPARHRSLAGAAASLDVRIPAPHRPIATPSRSRRRRRRARFRPFRAGLGGESKISSTRVRILCAALAHASYRARKSKAQTAGAEEVSISFTGLFRSAHFDFEDDAARVANVHRLRVLRRPCAGFRAMLQTTLASAHLALEAFRAGDMANKAIGSSTEAFNINSREDHGPVRRRAPAAAHPAAGIEIPR